MAAYNPLSIPEKEIRTITLLPGLVDDTIHCQLQTVSLNHSPNYEARVSKNHSNDGMIDMK